VAVAVLGAMPATLMADALAESLAKLQFELLV
jgi:hypothetical protein